jgi:hypothetical protein
MMATDSENTPTEAEIKEAQIAMRAELRSNWSRWAAEHEDWIQDATLAWIAADGPRLPALAVAAVKSIAYSAARTEKRRRDALDGGNGAADTTRPGVTELAAAGEKLRGTPGPTVTLALKLRDLREVTPDELTIDRLERDLGALAGRWQIAADAHPDDERAQQVADLLFVAAMPAHAAELAAKARHRIESENLGRRSRAQEADAFIGAAGRGNAEDVIRWLRVLPKVAAGTVLPPCRQPWPAADRQAAVEAVERALLETIAAEPAQRAKAVLVALGCPASKARNLDAHLAKRKSRAR